MTPPKRAACNRIIYVVAMAEKNGLGGYVPSTQSRLVVTACYSSMPSLNDLFPVYPDGLASG